MLRIAFTWFARGVAVAVGAALTLVGAESYQAPDLRVDVSRTLMLCGGAQP